MEITIDATKLAIAVIIIVLIFIVVHKSSHKHGECKLADDKPKRIGASECKKEGSPLDDCIATFLSRQSEALRMVG